MTKRFTHITREEFEDFLKQRPERWGPVKHADANELVYRTAQFAPNNDDLALWLYSSIDQYTGKTREKGSDAIRLVVVHDDREHLKIGRKKTLRINTWRKNLRKKINSLMREGDSMITYCGNCGAVMTKRKGEYGEFLGCTNFPKCNNTQQLDNE